MLSLHLFRICKLIYLVNCICNPSVKTHGTSMVIVDIREVWETWSLVHTFPAKTEQGDALTSCFHAHIVNQCPFLHLFTFTFFIFLCFLLVIPLFKVAPKPIQCCSAVHCSKHKKAVMCLSEKIRMSEKFLSDVSYSAAGHQFTVNESTVYIK